MSSPPMVGIVILNYNAEEECLVAVKSLLEVETYTRYKVAVVDNDSPNKVSRELLARSLPDCVSYIQNTKNGGYAAGNNVGAKFLIREVKAQYILVMNSDTIVVQPLLLSLLNELETYGAAAASPLVSDEAPADEWRHGPQVRRVPNLLRFVIANSGLLSRVPGVKGIAEEYIYKELMPWGGQSHIVDSINGACFIIRAEVLSEIGYFDERTFLYGEELILGYQLKSLGYLCVLDGNVRIRHLQGKSTGEHSGIMPRSMFEHMLESYRVIIMEYYRAPWVLALLFQSLKRFEYFLKHTISRPKCT